MQMQSKVHSSSSSSMRMSDKKVLEKILTNGEEKRVKTKIVTPFVTCPICKRLFRDATSVPECLHTFCKRCIIEKLTEEKLNNCPVCNTYLGCAPVERLRPDHHLQDIRDRVISASKIETKKLSKAASSVSSPSRRKQESLSNFGTPNVPHSSNHHTVKTSSEKPISRKTQTSQGPMAVSTEIPIIEVEDSPESSSPPVTPRKIVRYKRKRSEKRVSDRGNKERTNEPMETISDLWGPLKDASTKTKLNESKPQGSVTKLAFPSVNDDEELYVPQVEVKEIGNELNVHDDENGSNAPRSGLVKPRKKRGGRKKKGVSSEVEYHPEIPIPHVTIGMSSVMAESSEKRVPNKGKERSGEPLESISDILEPLGDACITTNFNESISQDYVDRLAPIDDDDDDDDEYVPRVKVNDDEYVPRVKVKENVIQSKTVNDYGHASKSGSVKTKRKRSGRKKKEFSYEAVKVPKQTMDDTVENKSEKRVNPIWLTLVASDDQEGDPPLSQIPIGYLMIKDVNVPVSFVQKYIAKKLDLDGEDEVEITLEGQPLIPTLELHKLIDFWCHTAPNASERVKTSVGGSARDFVMSLNYGRKA